VAGGTIGFKAMPKPCGLGHATRAMGAKAHIFFVIVITCPAVLEIWRANYLGAGIYDCEVTQTDQFSRRRHDKSLFDSDIARYVIPARAGIHSSDTLLDTCFRRYDKANRSV